MPDPEIRSVLPIAICAIAGVLLLAAAFGASMNGWRGAIGILVVMLSTVFGVSLGIGLAVYFQLLPNPPR